MSEATSKPFLSNARVEKSQPSATPIEISVDGKRLEVLPGVTLASALLAAGILTLKYSFKGRTPRSLFCGMGVCYECALTVNGRPLVRACMTVVKPGMVVEMER